MQQCSFEAGRLNAVTFGRRTFGVGQSFNRSRLCC